ncbi:hypothetical protein DOP62_14265 (plasmid) [Synechococcus elongatus PCC 11801]|uniref:Uncharacterized protein n=1 Tax=Synechococcus elongatus PCC 11801 TaxID=2219813 RepID=A0ACD5A322_SYNEL
MAYRVIEPAMQAKQYKPIAPLPEGAKLGGKVFGTRLPSEVEAALQDMPQADRVALIRAAITEAALKHWPADRPLPEWAAEFSPSVSAS